MNWARKVGRAGAELGLLTPGAILLLWSLADRADQDWSCFPSIKDDLAPDSAQSERSVKRHIELFREQGLVTTEARHNSMGFRIGMRYYLHEDALLPLEEEAAAHRAKRLEMEEKAEPEMGKNREISGGAELAPRSKTRENSGSAKMAPRLKNPQIPGSAKLAPRESLGAKRDKNSLGAFKRNARGFNHHHQSAAETIDDDSAVKDLVANDPGTLLLGWQTGIDDEMLLVHRSVDVLALAASGTMFNIHQPVRVWHRVIELILERSSGTVRMPHAYVLAAFSSAARTVIVEALQSLETPAEKAQDVFTAPIVVKCEDHSWSGREGAVCPSCRADALVGEPVVEETVSEPLTEAQIASLPPAYRHMVSPEFQAPPPSPEFHDEDPHDDDDVAPWDRDDLVRR